MTVMTFQIRIKCFSHVTSIVYIFWYYNVFNINCRVKFERTYLIFDAL
jgi:hypothetical protein